MDRSEDRIGNGWKLELPLRSGLWQRLTRRTLSLENSLSGSNTESMASIFFFLLPTNSQDFIFVLVRASERRTRTRIWVRSWFGRKQGFLYIETVTPLDCNLRVPVSSRFGVTLLENSKSLFIDLAIFHLNSAISIVMSFFNFLIQCEYFKLH